MTKHIILYFCTIMAMVTNVTAQQVEVDFSIGVHVSKVFLHHNNNYLDIKGHEKDFQAWESDHSAVGAATRLWKNLHFKTELGFIKTKTGLDFTYGSSKKYAKRYSTLLLNNRIYLGLYPEYRIPIFKRLNLKVYAGPMLSMDLFHIISLDNKALIPSGDGPLGFKAGAGVSYSLRNISLSIHGSYIGFAKSYLPNLPRVSYLLRGMTASVAYTIGSPNRSKLLEE